MCIALLIDTGARSFDVRDVVVERRNPHYCSLLYPATLSMPPSLGAMQTAGRAHQASEGNSRDRVWLERRAEDDTK